MPKSFLLKRNHVSNELGSGDVAVGVKEEVITTTTEDLLVIVGSNVVVKDETSDTSTDEDDAWHIGKPNYSISN